MLDLNTEHDVKTDLMVRIFGMRRSGNHAIIYWLLQHEQNNYFFNDANVPFDARCMLRRLRVKLPYRKKLTVVSWENKPLDAKLYLKDIERSHEKTVLIMRDPYNWLASYLQNRWSVNKQLMSQYMKYLEEYTGETNKLGDKILINYNRWFIDRAYRQSIIHNLGLGELDDAAIDYVPQEGGGSSFNGFKFQGNGRQMDVLGRWKNYADKPEYTRWLRWPGLTELAERVWPEMCREHQSYYMRNELRLL